MAVRGPHLIALAAATLVVASTWVAAARRMRPATPADRDDLVAFLQSLTDDALLRDPRFADPWPAHDRTR